VESSEANTYSTLRAWVCTPKFSKSIKNLYLWPWRREYEKTTLKTCELSNDWMQSTINVMRVSSTRTRSLAQLMEEPLLRWEMWEHCSEIGWYRPIYRFPGRSSADMDHAIFCGKLKCLCEHITSCNGFAWLAEFNWFGCFNIRNQRKVNAHAVDTFESHKLPTCQLNSKRSSSLIC